MVTANPHGNWEAHCERMQQEADESLARSGHREHADDGPIAEGWQLTVGHGHSGFGIYAHIEEYPEEGAIFWRSLNDVQTEAYAEGRKDEAEATQALRDLLAKVPLPPNAITYEKGWALLDELQALAIRAATPE